MLNHFMFVFWRLMVGGWSKLRKRTVMESRPVIIFNNCAAHTSIDKFLTTSVFILQTRIYVGDLNICKRVPILKGEVEYDPRNV
ncbi:predicted protein [Sclerotinia sclerotiorum 1980 UF-70]|uniref:DDE-1 domain-containing protein n=1 Tax=Sclerotinia sclerotiorum (strain ATCC 18683 / 1980 / Ss-1) TaxID=665079 RepID=A7F853_SCLS1|nr:predicted protein [Sclerotinia sclerotiorum 1980 UF-70]EDN98924.1 predicted protein [Sclerotinia sclerotiorum 1980 UF-70]